MILKKLPDSGNFANKLGILVVLQFHLLLLNCNLHSSRVINAAFLIEFKKSKLFLQNLFCIGVHPINLSHISSFDKSIFFCLAIDLFI